jgi:two-component system phosphate regulon sensor histidine kinase PhoR
MARRKTILDQIYPVFLITVLVVVVLSVVVTHRVFRNFRTTAFREQLVQETELLVLLFSHSGGEREPADLFPVIEAVENLTVRLYSPDGKLLAATDESLPAPPPSDVLTMLRAPMPRGRTIRDEANTFHVLEPFIWRQRRYLLSTSRPVAAVEEETNSLISTLVLTGVIILLTTSAVLAHLVSRLKKPLQVLQKAASAYAEGRLDHRFQVSRPHEMALLAETMNGMAEQLTSRIRAISSQRNQLEAMLSGMVEGVLLVSRDGRVRTINEAACDLFSVEPDKVVRQPLLEAVRNSELYDFYQRTRASQGTTEGGIQVYRESTRYLQAHGSLLKGDEGGDDVLIVLNDITRIKRLEAIRQEFVANVSHELKTPITSILGFVETLQDGAIDEPKEARAFLGIVANHTRRLNSIIDDLLQLARLEQSEERIPLESVDPRELISRAVEACGYAARQKGIKVRMEVDTELAALQGARTLLERALINLVDNAVKYSPHESSVVVRLRSREKAYGGRSCVFSVTDNGPGIAPVEQARVFERFYRVDKTRSRQLGGTGLGLAIVKHVALVHGGSVDLESERGKGSTFIVEIPESPRPRSAEEEPTREASDEAEKELHRSNYRP